MVSGVLKGERGKRESERVIFFFSFLGGRGGRGGGVSLALNLKLELGNGKTSRSFRGFLRLEYKYPGVFYFFF